MAKIQLGKYDIGDDSPPYVIAEIGVNHAGSLELAKKLIDLAKEGGADAAKFQTYKAETLASKNSPAYWDTSKESTTSQYALFKKFDRFTKPDYLALAQHCKQQNIDFLSTPFDLDSVDFLAPLVAFFKIASADITNLPLLRKIAATGKPVVLSSGAATLAEIDMAVHELHAFGALNLALLHCVLNYPTANENAHLNMILGIKRAYPELVVGYSDHTVPDANMTVLTTAYLKGARIIEKHFTHDKTLPGNDHYHAMDTNDLRCFKEKLALLRQIEGQHHKAPLVSENVSRANARRSIVLTTDVAANTSLEECHLICKRPGTGISPIHWDQIIGTRTLRELSADDILQWQDLASSAVLAS